MLQIYHWTFIGCGPVIGSKSFGKAELSTAQVNQYLSHQCVACFINVIFVEVSHELQMLLGKCGVCNSYT